MCCYAPLHPHNVSQRTSSFNGPFCNLLWILKEQSQHTGLSKLQQQFTFPQASKAYYMVPAEHSLSKSLTLHLQSQKLHKKTSWSIILLILFHYCRAAGNAAFQWDGLADQVTLWNSQLDKLPQQLEGNDAFLKALHKTRTRPQKCTIPALAG